MTRPAELGEFLRSRRARISPELLGLDSGTRRRVPGLRREELAAQAHVSVDYLVRLEQGRIGRPSPEVVEALARALLLDGAERRHLFRLAAAGEPAPEGDGEVVRPGLALLVRSLEPSPAVLLSRRLDLLAYNETAEQLLGPFEVERNYARIVLLDPRSRALHDDWEEAARQTVALLRFAAARHPQDAALHALTAELRAVSPSVAEWWAGGDVAQKRHGVKRYRHPRVGDLALRFEAMLLADDGDQILTIYAAEPGTVDAERLSELRATARS